MPLKTDAYFKTIAEKALRQTGILEPPVAVEAVAARLGIPVRIVHMPAFFSGATLNEDGMPVVILNAFFDEATARRVLAHLIAHVLMVLDDPSVGYPRNDESDHRDADVLASEMIMPTWMVMEQAAKWFNDQRYLARLFGVSESEMLAKMCALGLIKARGIVWEY